MAWPSLDSCNPSTFPNRDYPFALPARRLSGSSNEWNFYSFHIGQRPTDTDCLPQLGQIPWNAPPRKASGGYSG